MSAEPPPCCRAGPPVGGLIGALQTLAEAVYEVAIALREIVEETVDRFDDDAPLGQAGDSAERVEARLELVGNADAELRTVLYLLALFSTCGWAAYATAFSNTVVGHSRKRW